MTGEQPSCRGQASYPVDPHDWGPFEPHPEDDSLEWLIEALQFDGKPSRPP